MSYEDELVRQLFLLTSAGLGSVFAALYPLATTVTAATHDEDHDHTYVVRVVVGLISGTILSQLVGIDSLGSLGDLTKPTLALLGGFSASLVFTVLTRLVEGLQSVFVGDPTLAPEIEAAAGAAANARAEAKLLEERLTVGRHLLEIQSRHGAGAVGADLERLTRQLLRGELTH